MSLLKGFQKAVSVAVEIGKTKKAEYDEWQKKKEAERIEREKREEAERIEREKREEAELLVRREKNDKNLRSFYENKMSVMGRQYDGLRFTDKVMHNGKWTETDFNISFSISRSLTTMSAREIEISKYAELLYNSGIFDKVAISRIILSMIYNDGKCDCKVINSNWKLLYAQKHSITNDAEAIKHVMDQFECSNKEAGISFFLTQFSLLEKNYENHPLVKEVRAKLIGGSKWLTDDEIKSAVSASNNEEYSMFIGATENGTRFWYGQEGSIVSIAPPGSGKTQCHVFPNLLTYRGPAVVLDIKGECYDMTSSWRQTNVGPVYKFNPLDAAASARYNPLINISEDPDILWEECRLIADLLIIPINMSDPTWENRARDIVAGIIAWMVIKNPPEKRSMAKVIDVVSKVGWEDFVDEAKYIMEIPAVSRLGNALAAMPDKQLEGVLDAARRHLAIWEGNRVEKVTSTCDWTPEVLRNGSGATIYICIPPNEIETYAPLLRVILAQHLRYLLRELPAKGTTQKPILFMLDEMPRLGAMKPIEEALEVGRQYGIRLWMFAQSLGQLQKAYTNSEGMIGSCALRIFMNPSSHDGTAKKISEELGYVESIIDGSRQLMVEANDLSGPDYADYQIAFARNTRPAKLKKVFAYSDPEFSKKLGSLVN